MNLLNGAMWDARYSGEGYAYGTAPNAFLAARRRG